MRHPFRALLVAPLVVPLAFWVFSLVVEAFRGASMSAGMILGELQIIALVGGPIAYAASVVWGLPAVFVLHRARRLAAWTLVFAGAVGGTIVAWLIVSFQSGDMFRVRMPWPVGAGLGALTGVVAWRVGGGAAAPQQTADPVRG